MDYFFFFFISSLFAAVLLAQQGCTSIAPLDDAPPSVNSKYEPCQGGIYWCAGGISAVCGRE